MSSQLNLTLDDLLNAIRSINELVLNAETKEVSPDSIHSRPDFLLSSREYRTARTGKQAAEDLQTNLESMGQISPIVLTRQASADPQLILLTGSKRLESARLAGLKTLKAKIIACSEIERCFSNSLSSEAAMIHVSHWLTMTDAIHSDKATDEQLFHFLCQLRTSVQLEREDFEDVMKILGLTRRKPSYRNTLRLWSVACCERAADLVFKKYIRLSFAKRDICTKVLSEDEAGQKSFTRIEAYIQSLKENSKKPESLEGNPPFKWTGYDDKVILDIIQEENSPRSSQRARLIQRYKPPQFSLKYGKSFVSLPEVKIDFSSMDTSEVTQVVEVYYQVKNLSDNLHRFLKQISPEIAGETCVLPKSFEIPKPAYDEKYYSFIRSLNLELYCNVEQLSSYLDSKGKSLISLDQQKEMKRSERQVALLQKLVSLSVDENKAREKQSLLAELQVVSEGGKS